MRHLMVSPLKLISRERKLQDLTMLKVYKYSKQKNATRIVAFYFIFRPDVTEFLGYMALGLLVLKLPVSYKCYDIPYESSEK